MSNTQSAWKIFFTTWPHEMPRRGLLITSLGEQVPFNGFMTSEHFLVVSRPAPDSLGARTVMLPYENLAAMKLTDVVKSDVFKAAGFHGELGRQ